MRYVRGNLRSTPIHPNRPRTRVTALKSVAAVEKSKNQLSRDFRCRPIFDFCSTIVPQTDTSDLERTPTETSTRGASSSNAMASLLREDSL
jgi:hypothetical protein